MMVSFVLSFFPRDVLDEILNLIESVSEDFPSYSFIRDAFVHREHVVTVLFTWRKHTLQPGDMVKDLHDLVGCFGFNGPSRQYFSLYRAVSIREGDRGEKNRRE